MKQLVTFRIDPDLLAKARGMAQRENRTLTNFVETVLKQVVDESEPRPTPGREPGAPPSTDHAQRLEA